MRFAESAVRNDSDLDFARSNLESAIGTSGVVEAAATVSAFEGLNRIADATGIQLDSGLADFRKKDFANLHLNSHFLQNLSPLMTLNHVLNTKNNLLQESIPLQKRLQG